MSCPRPISRMPRTPVFARNAMTSAVETTTNTPHTSTNPRTSQSTARPLRSGRNSTVAECEFAVIWLATGSSFFFRCNRRGSVARGLHVGDRDEPLHAREDALLELRREHVVDER